MFLVTSNKAKQLLCSSFIGRVRPEEIARSREESAVLLNDLQPGFRLLVDLSRVEDISLDCVPEIGRLMELMDHAGVSTVVRVIPDPTKDIGMNIISRFHYPNHPKIMTCETLLRAAEMLEL